MIIRWLDFNKPLKIETTTAIHAVTNTIYDYHGFRNNEALEWTKQNGDMKNGISLW